MKVKLLKKIRKRYTWYLNVHGFPVLLDHRYSDVKIINKDYISDLYKKPFEQVEKEVDFEPKKLAWRVLLHTMLSRYGWHTTTHYKRAMRISKRKSK